MRRTGTRKHHCSRLQASMLAVVAWGAVVAGPAEPAVVANVASAAFVEGSGARGASHSNEVLTAIQTETFGSCTPGFWRTWTGTGPGGQHDAWAATGLDRGADFDAVFGTSLFPRGLTLFEAVRAGGGNARRLARHGTAALLNASHPDVSYPISLAAVIAAVRAAETDLLEGYNEAFDCPIGRRADPVADLVMAKVLAPDSTGTASTFVLTVRNAGPDPATGVVVGDPLPSGYTFSGADSAAYDTATGLWSVGELARGESRTLRVTVSVNSQGEFRNIASATANEIDPNPGDNSASASVAVPPTVTPIAGNRTCAQLVPGTLALNVDPVRSGSYTGDAVTITIEVDLTPSGQTLGWSSTAPIAAVFVKGGSSGNLYTYGDATAGEDLHAPANRSGRYADLSHLLFCHYDQSRRTMAAPTAAEEPRLDFVKRVDVERVQVGDGVAYRLEITNESPTASATHLRVRDVLPAGMRFVPGSAWLTLPAGDVVALASTGEGSTQQWSLPPLPPLERFAITYRVVVLPGSPAPATLLNVATLVAEDADGEVLMALERSAAVRVTVGIFAQWATLVGVVFIDHDGDGHFTHGIDEGVSGVRLFLSSGRSVVTDGSGRYTVPEIEPGLAALRADPLTLPAELVPLPGDAAPGLWRVRLLPGLITRQDVPLDAANLSRDVIDALAQAPVDSAATIERTPTQYGADRAVIVSPEEQGIAPGAGGATVVVDTPLGHDVDLVVGDERVDDNRLAEQVRDGPRGRQRFTYMGVALAEGPNLLRLVSRSPDGETFVDEVTVFAPGAPAVLEIAAVGPLEADAVAPLRFEVLVRDAWGKASKDGLVTLEVEGASFADADADWQQAGHQVSMRAGRARFDLVAPAEAGVIVVGASAGAARASARFIAGPALRPWIASGVGSVGAAYAPGEGLSFGLSSSVFARGTVFGDALLSVAFGSSLAPLGSHENPHERFPVVGSNDVLGQEATSRHGVFARLERGLDYVQYGDFESGFIGRLPTPRDYTGVSGNYMAPSGLGLRAYAAYQAMGDDVVDVDVRSDGTSIYRLPGAPIVPGTLRLSVVKVDRLDGRVELDDDPLVQALRPQDYAFDAVSGIVRLARPLPLFDDDGRAYRLRATYRVVDAASTPRAVQFGVQGRYEADGFVAFAGFSQETRSQGSITELASAGVTLEREGLTIEAEIGYGSDAISGGIGAALSASHAAGPIRARALYEYFGVGYRSPQMTNDADAGHGVQVDVGYDVTSELSVSAAGRLVARSLDANLQYTGNLVGTYQSATTLMLAGAALGVRPTLHLGLQVDNALAGGAAYLGLLSGVAVRDVLGVVGSEVRIGHLQSLGSARASVTDLSVAYRITDAVQVRALDRIEWGVSNTFSLGLEGRIDHARLQGRSCTSEACESLPSASRGSSTVGATYEREAGSGTAGGRLRVGVDTRYPISPDVGVRASITYVHDLIDASRSATVLTSGLSYDGDELDARIGFELRLEPDAIKQVVTFGSTFALGSALYGGVDATYLRDPGATVVHGVAFGIAGAYRGDMLDVLTNHRGRTGSLRSGGADELHGDTRIAYRLAPTFGVRVGHVYRLRADDGLVQMLSLGGNADVWQGGTVAVSGHVFHHGGEGVTSLGASLELSHALGCGAYGVVGANLGAGPGAGGALSGRSGIFVRVDVAFDERWRCGTSGVEGSR